MLCNRAKVIDVYDNAKSPVRKLIEILTCAH